MKYAYQIGSILIMIVLLCASLSFAGEKQLQDRALTFGSQGHFSFAKDDLIELSNTLSNAKPNNTFDEQGRLIAALGFVQIMESIANDCLSGRLSEEIGKLLFQAGISAGKANFDKAISLTKKAITSKSQYPLSYLLLGRLSSHSCLERGTDCQKAIDVYRTALKYDPNMAVAYLDLGMVYTQSQQLELAINAYKSALDLNVAGLMTGWAHEQLSLLYAMQEKWLLAERHSKISSSLGMPLPAELGSEIENKLHNKADLNEELFDAVRNGNTNKVKTLLDKGADVNAKFKGRGTLLHGAALNGQKDLVELLISKGADVNAKDDKYGATSLHLAAYKGHQEVVQVLLAEGADIYAKDREGDTPLDNALAGGHRDVAELIKNFAGNK